MPKLLSVAAVLVCRCWLCCSQVLLVSCTGAASSAASSERRRAVQRLVSSHPGLGLRLRSSEAGAAGLCVVLWRQVPGRAGWCAGLHLSLWRGQRQQPAYPGSPLGLLPSLVHNVCMRALVCGSAARTAWPGCWQGRRGRCAGQPSQSRAPGQRGGGWVVLAVAATRRALLAEAAHPKHGRLPGQRRAPGGRQGCAVCFGARCRAGRAGFVVSLRTSLCGGHVTSSLPALRQPSRPAAAACPS
jgi:hypothetical protein